MSRESEARVRRALEAVGFELIQDEVHASTKGKPLWTDVLAWAANAQGELVPWAVVEIKDGSKSSAIAALPQLARARELFGTVDHYVVQDGRWFKADGGLLELEPVDGPAAPPFGSRGELNDIVLATKLVSDRLWRDADMVRQSGRPLRVDNVFRREAKSATTEPRGGLRTPEGNWVPVNKHVLWEASRRGIVGHARRMTDGAEHTSHPIVSQAVAALAGPKLTSEAWDPFCGSGAFLWDAVDYAVAHRTGLHTVYGVDINAGMVNLARGIAENSPIPVEIQLADSLELNTFPRFKAVLTAPPVGMRLQNPWRLLDDSFTKEMQVAAVDLAVRSLSDGGRAVLHVPTGFVSRKANERYRQWLSHNYRVGALIGLPTGSYQNTRITSVLLVIDANDPGPTFVAQLGYDWQDRIAPGGAALEQARLHLGGESGARS